MKHMHPDGLTRTKVSLNFSMRNQIAEGSSQWPPRGIIESRARNEQGEDARLMRRRAAPNLHNELSDSFVNGIPLIRSRDFNMFYFLRWDRPAS